jgi:hypothetical protein
MATLCILYLNMFNNARLVNSIGKSGGADGGKSEGKRVESQPAARAVCHRAGCPGRSFDAFALSNIGDGISDAYRERLVAGVERAARRKAVVIEQSFGEPKSRYAENLAAADRSLLWGVVSVVGADDWRRGGGRCCIG